MRSSPLRQPCPVGGSIAHAMPLYDVYLNVLFLKKQVIQHYRNRGAPAAGRSPEIVRYLNDFHKKGLLATGNPEVMR